MGISREQALNCFASDDLIGIGMEADAVRRRLHPEGVVSYAMDGVLDLPRFVTPAATFDLESIPREIADLLDLGAKGILLHGNPRLPVPALETLLTSLHQHFPAIPLHGLSSATILESAALSGLSPEESLRRLHAAGLAAISGSAADIELHRLAHTLGLKSTVTLVFGAGEPPHQRVAQLLALRDLQQQTGGFTAIHPITTPQRDLAPGLEEATAVEYLQTLAIARMLLDNIENLQASLPSQGLKVLQMGLRFGSNDAGSVLLRANAPRAAGLSLGSTEEELRRLIRDAGFRPVQRDPLFSTMYLN